MRSRPLVRIAAAEGLLVLALGMAVVVRGGEVPAPARNTDSAAGERRAEAAREQVERATDQAAEHLAHPDLPLEAALPVESVGANDPVGLVLYGTLQDQEGQPLRSWIVSLKAADPGSTLQLSTSNDRFPTWSLSGIPPGNYHLRCNSTGFQAIEEDIVLLPAPRVQRRDFVLVRLLAVKVRFVMPEGDPGTPLAFDRHAVLATAEELPARIPILDGGNLPFQTLGSWQPNQDGSLGKEFAGQILLRRPPPLYLHVFLGPVRLQSLHLAEMRPEVTFTIDAASLRGAVGGLRFRIVDASTGLPVTAAFVNVGGGGSSPDAHGVFERADLAPGRQDLWVWTENRYAAVARVVEIRAGERLDLGDIQLGPSHTLRGIVVDQSEKGTVAYVFAVPLLDAQAPLSVPVLQAESRADGRFDLAGVGEGRYLLRATTGDGERMGLAVAEVGSTADVRVVLQPTFPVQIVCRLGVYEECRANIRTVAGHPLMCQRLQGPRPARFRLPEGQYVLELSGAGHDQRRGFTVTQQGAALELP